MCSHVLSPVISIGVIRIDLNDDPFAFFFNRLKYVDSFTLAIRTILLLANSCEYLFYYPFPRVPITSNVKPSNNAAK